MSVSVDGRGQTVDPEDNGSSSFRASWLRQDRRDLFWKFVRERQLIWQRRSSGDPPPWTSDPVLQMFRFTNVYRELDPGTQYALREILERPEPSPDRLFNLMLYRLIGRSETHATLGFQRLTEFDAKQFERTLKRRRKQGAPVFTAAYMVSAYSSMGSNDKIENVSKLFNSLHREFRLLWAEVDRAQHPATVYETLRSREGFGNFLAYQILVDTLYPLETNRNRPLLPFSHDLWAAAGPGAQAGISMLLAPDTRPSHLSVMRWLRDHQADEFARFDLQFPYLINKDRTLRPISLANIQNCLCEFHKYVKIREGTGRARRRFFPSDAYDARQTILPDASPEVR